MEINSMKNLTLAVILNLMLVTLVAYALSFTIKHIIVFETNNQNVLDYIPVFNDVYYLLCEVVLICLFVVAAFLWAEKGHIIDKIMSMLTTGQTNFYVSISISLSLIFIGLIYPMIPSIDSYHNKAESLLEENIKDVSNDVGAALIAGDYNYLNNEFIESRDVGYMHFRLVPNDAIKNNISLLSVGDYFPVYPESNVAGGPVTWVVDMKANTRLHLDDASSSYWDYTDKELINKANRVGISFDLIGSVNNCYDFYYQSRTKEIFSDPIDKKRICPSDANTHKVVMSATARGKEKIDSFRFWVKPAVITNNKAKNPWEVANVKIFTDKSGLGKNVLGYCVEGFHDGLKEKVIHINGDDIFPGAC